MKNKKTAILGFLIGVVLASGAYSLWMYNRDNKIENMHILMNFTENHIKTVSILKDFDNGLVTAEYTGILLKRQANTIERMHDLAILSIPSKKKQVANKALGEVLESLDTLHTKFINEELMKLEESSISLNKAAKSYLEAIE